MFKWYTRRKAKLKQTPEEKLGLSDADLYRGPPFLYVYRCLCCDKVVLGATRDGVFQKRGVVSPKWKFAANMRQLLSAIWDERHPDTVVHDCSDNRCGIAELIGVVRAPEEESKKCPDATPAETSSSSLED